MSPNERISSKSVEQLSSLLVQAHQRHLDLNRGKCSPNLLLYVALSLAGNSAISAPFLGPDGGKDCVRLREHLSKLS